MKKVVLPLMVLVLCVCSCAQAKPAKVGVLAPIGQDEKDIIQWTENVADLEGRVKMFRNSSTISIYDDLNAMVMALKAGQIDRISIGLHTARYIAARDEAFEFIDNNYNAVMGYAVAVREDDKARLPGINLAIQKMRADGTLERLIKEHILTVETEDPKAVEIPKFKGEDTIRFAVTGDLPPMDCILADGTPAGFNTAFLAELAAHIKKNIELVSVSAGARQAAIASGKVDALFWTRGVYNRTFQVLPYPVDKVSGVVISEPYLLESRAAVAMKQPEKGAKLRYIAQLKTEKLAAQRGTVGQFIAEDMLGDSKGKLLTTFEKYVDAIAALRQGKVRAVVMDEMPAKRYLSEIEGLTVMDKALSEENYAIGFKKGNAELVEQVNKILAEMKADGTLDAIFTRYLAGDYSSVKPEDIDLNKGAKGGKLYVGTEAGFAPYELRVGNGFIGIDVEMCAHIAKKLGKELVILNMNFDALPTAVSTGKVDMICAGITVTDERKENMDFSDNYVVGAKQVAVVRADDYE